MNLKQMIHSFLMGAKKKPAPAIVDSFGVMSFSELEIAVTRLTYELEIQKRSYLIISEPNSRNHFIGFLACIMSDTVFCPINPKTKNNVLDDIINEFSPGTSSVFHTSGSTGKSKGVLIKDTAIEANIRNSTNHQLLDQNSIILSHLDFSHSGGFFLQSLPGLINFGKIIITTNFIPKVILQLIHLHKPTHTILLPSQMSLLKRSKEYSLLTNHPFKFILTGSQNLNAKFVKEALLNSHHLINVYGLTECGPFAIFHLFDKSFQDDIVPMGKPVKELIWKISNDGELLVAGQLVSAGYINQNILHENEFFETKDIVRIEDDLFYFMGRKNDLFQVGGLTVNPIEIEDKILKNILSIEECLIFPVTHGQLVNIPAVLIKLKKNTPKETLNFQALLDKHCIPQIIIYVDRIPLNINGKPDRRKALTFITR